MLWKYVSERLQSVGSSGGEECFLKVVESCDTRWGWMWLRGRPVNGRSRWSFEVGCSCVGLLSWVQLSALVMFSIQAHTQQM